MPARGPLLVPLPQLTSLGFFMVSGSILWGQESGTKGAAGCLWYKSLQYAFD